MVNSREAILQILRGHRSEWERLGVKSLALFGSAVREDLRPDSDVDILVEFNGPATFDRYIELKFRLEALLGRPVDLVTPRALKPRLRPYVEREAIRVS